MKESESKEQLYICDHADGCGDVGCVRAKRHGYKLSGFLCGFVGCNVSDIPYKEEPEGSEYIHIADGLEDEKSEPKTKRFAVIWFGEVPVDKCENPVICDEMTGYLYDQVELIDGDRVRDWWSGPIGGDRTRHIAIDPPTPEPQEAVDDVLRRMPNPKNYQDPISGVINLRGYYKVMKSCFKDFKAAQEREGV